MKVWHLFDMTKPREDGELGVLHVSLGASHEVELWEFTS